MTASVNSLDRWRFAPISPILKRIMRGETRWRIGLRRHLTRPLGPRRRARGFLTASNGAVCRGAHQLIRRRPAPTERSRADIALFVGTDESWCSQKCH